MRQSGKVDLRGSAVVVGAAIAGAQIVVIVEVVAERRIEVRMVVEGYVVPAPRQGAAAAGSVQSRESRVES